MKDRKLIFNVKGKDELMKVVVMKERDKVFICLIKYDLWQIVAS